MSKETTMIGKVVVVGIFLLGIAFSLGFAMNSIEHNSAELESQAKTAQVAETRLDRIEVVLEKLLLLDKIHSARFDRLEKE